MALKRLELIIVKLLASLLVKESLQRGDGLFHPLPDVSIIVVFSCGPRSEYVIIGQLGLVDGRQISSILCLVVKVVHIDEFIVGRYWQPE